METLFFRPNYNHHPSCYVPYELANDRRSSPIVTGSLKMVGVIMGWVNPKAPGFLLDPVMLAWVMGVLEVSLAVLIRFCLPRVAGAAVLAGLGFVFIFYRGVEGIFVQPGGGCPCLGGITSVAPWLRAFEQPLLTALALFLLLFGAWAYLWESSFIKKSSA